MSPFEQREALLDEARELPWSQAEGPLGEELFSFEARIPGHEDWYFRATYVVGDDLVLVGLSIGRATLDLPHGGLQTKVIRSVKLGDMLLQAREMASLPFGLGIGAQLRVPRDDFGRPLRVGRPGHDDLYYAEFAAKYVDYVSRFSSPTAQLAGDEHLDDQTVRGMLQRARKRGLLTPAPPGKAGGSLTAKCLGILKDAQEAGA